MGSHPLNLAIRFLLEITGFMSLGIWGWHQSGGWLRFLLAIGIPLIFALIWGTFAVPDDPSRSGKAPVVTPGIIRLAIEMVFFVCAIWSLYDVGFKKQGAVFCIIVVLHYTLSYDRIKWLLKK